MDRMTILTSITWLFWRSFESPFSPSMFSSLTRLGTVLPGETEPWGARSCICWAGCGAMMEGGQSRGLGEPDTWYRWWSWHDSGGTWLLTLTWPITGWWITEVAAVIGITPPPSILRIGIGESEGDNTSLMAVRRKGLSLHQTLLCLTPFKTSVTESGV